MSGRGRRGAAIFRHPVFYGKTTWYDGLTFAAFISFEHFLANPQPAAHHISPEIRAAITAHLSKEEIKAQPEDATGEDTEEMKRIFMENSGMRHYIHREYGDFYKPAPLDELAWKKELIEKYKQQLRTEDNLTVLRYIATTLHYHGVPELEDLLMETAKMATLEARQAISQLLGELFGGDQLETFE